MAWKCNSCQTEIDVSDGIEMRFCPKCGAPAQIKSSPSQENSQKQNVCPVCCSEIEGGDTITCPDCKMVYHKDCWNDNNGCATYGCKSAGCLNPPPMVIDVDNGSKPSQNTGTRQNGFRCPHCNTELEAGASFCWSCGAELRESFDVSSNNAPLSGPWERWISRFIDYTLGSVVSAIFLSIFFDLSDVPDAVVGIICAPFAFLLDSAVYAVFGNTLGKWLWGIKIVENNGIKISAGRYFNRNLRVYWGGYGLAIPIVTLCTFITQYNRVSKGNPSTYDEIMGVKSIRPNPNGLKAFFGVILIILVYILLIAAAVAAK